MTSLSEIARLLDELGSTPDEVAQHLRDEEIRGVRNAIRSLNPIVRFVQVRLCDDALQIDIVDSETLRLAGDRKSKRGLALPTAVQKFLIAFGSGSYPEIELTRQRS